MLEKLEEDITQIRAIVKKKKDCYKFCNEPDYNLSNAPPDFLSI